MKDKKDKIYYFQEKSNDILDLQDELNSEEIGIYFILKAGYFKYAGQLKKENANQRCKFFGDINKFNFMIDRLFDINNGLLVNNAWLSEINGIKSLSEKRKEIAKSRWETEQQKKDSKPNRNPKKPKETESVIESELDLEKKYFLSKLPNFIDQKLWKGFIDFRISISKKDKPFTENAKELLLKQLIEFEKKQAGFANQALENSIAGSYQGVFEPRINNPQQKSMMSKFNEPRDYSDRAGWDD